MRCRSTWIIVPLLAISAILCGCDGGGSGNDGPVELVISGTWMGSCLYEGDPHSVTLLLHESNGRITGVWDGYLVSGTASGNAIAITYNTVSGAGLPMAVYLDGAIEGSNMNSTITITVNGLPVSQVSCMLERQ